MRLLQQAGKALLVSPNHVLELAPPESGRLEREELGFDPRALVDETLQRVAFGAREVEETLRRVAFDARQVEETLRRVAFDARERRAVEILRVRPSRAARSASRRSPHLDGTPDRMAGMAVSR